VVVEAVRGGVLLRVVVVLVVVLMQLPAIPNTVLLLRQTRVVERLGEATPQAQAELLAVLE
jgi:hypothetical protein